jgi:hypothetical protein
MRTRRAFRVLVKLVAAGAFLPYTLFASDAYHLTDRDPLFFGGFSDVFRAFSETGQEVALKRLRVNARGEFKKDLIQASDSLTVHSKSDTVNLASLPRGPCVETAEASLHPTLHRR